MKLHKKICLVGFVDNEKKNPRFSEFFYKTSLVVTFNLKIYIFCYKNNNKFGNDLSEFSDKIKIAAK